MTLKKDDRIEMLIGNNDHELEWQRSNLKDACESLICSLRSVVGSLEDESPLINSAGAVQSRGSEIDMSIAKLMMRLAMKKQLARLAESED